MYKSHKKIDLHEDIEQIKSAFADASQDLRSKATEMINETIENAKARTGKLSETVHDKVSEKPYSYLGLAVLAGVAIGYFLRKE